jgi:hypothetical protein
MSPRRNKETNIVSEQLPVPAASNIFERINRLNPEGRESWSARDLAHVLEDLNFRNFQPVIEKAKEACAKSGHAVADHFAEIRNMIGCATRITPTAFTTKWAAKCE